MNQIITVAADKGGVGKSTLAWEIAGALDAVLLDFDFHGGGVTRTWSAEQPNDRLLVALERGPDGPPPRPRRAPRRPDLVPSHPDLSAFRLEGDHVLDCLAAWAAAWERPLVVDTHPGEGPLRDGALAAASVVVVPVVLATRELDALAGLLRDRPDHPFLLVPNMVPTPPPKRMIAELVALAGSRPVAPVIHDHRWLRRRRRRTPIVLDSSPSARVTAAAEEFRALAREVQTCLQTA